MNTGKMYFRESANKKFFFHARNRTFKSSTSNYNSKITEYLSLFFVLLLKKNRIKRHYA